MKDHDWFSNPRGKIYRLYISDSQAVRFTGRIEWWQRFFLWCAGVNVTEVKEGE